MSNTPLFKKAYGCLAGQAVGDAVGWITEGLHYEAIQHVFGKVTEDLLGTKGHQPDLGDCWGITTDDHADLEMVAKTIIRKGRRITVFDFAQGVMDFMNHTLVHWNEQAIAMRISGCVGEGSVSPHNLGQRQTNTPGPTFTCPPLAIVNACDPYGAAKDTYEVFTLWVEGFALEAAMAVASAIAEAFKPDATLESIVDASMRYCGPKVAAHIQKAVDLAEEFDDVYEAAFSPKLHKELCIDGEGFDCRAYLSSVAKCIPAEYVAGWDFRRKLGFKLPDDFDLGGHPIEMAAIPIAFFLIAKGDAMQAIRGAANFGRDCDGIAGIAGAIAGAWKGIDPSLESTVRKVDEYNKVWYKKSSGEDYLDIAVLAERMMKPILNTIKEREVTVSSLRKLVEQ